MRELVLLLRAAYRSYRELPHSELSDVARGECVQHFQGRDPGWEQRLAYQSGFQRGYRRAHLETKIAVLKRS